MDWVLVGAVTNCLFMEGEQERGWYSGLIQRRQSMGSEEMGQRTTQWDKEERERIEHRNN
jgi:hypothetical protein